MFVASGAPLLSDTLMVTSIADAGGTCPGADCTLRQAISTASSGNTIGVLLPASTSITLTRDQLAITNKSLTISGPEATS